MYPVLSQKLLNSQFKQRAAESNLRRLNLYGGENE